ncbi:MAG: nitrile hydratase accessory protein [Candidatus Handelsmanbacteria bacterium]|nr:nitrile hydratase accessory protein [Candidatus Handelsmanbacteria bacterium]
MSARKTPLDELDLPRQNGELAFDAPWKARAFGLAVALGENGLYAWKEFSQVLAAHTALAEQQGEDEAYYERWLNSLEHLALEKGFVTPAELEARAAELAAQDEHAH